MDNDVDKNLAVSMSSYNTEIIQYLPELLQDLWELGSSSSDVIDIIKNKVVNSEIENVLDLGCGKGAVLVKIAKELNLKVKGIDIIPEFIQIAKQKAEEYLVSDLCTFEIFDINQAVDNERGFDCVLWLSVGKILGSYKETLTKLSETVRIGGYIVIDDCFVNDTFDNEDLKYDYSYPTLNEWKALISEAGLSIVEQHIYEEDGLNEEYDKELLLIDNRAKELSNIYKDKEWLFNKYIETQKDEYYDLKYNTLGVLWLLKKEL